MYVFWFLVVLAIIYYVLLVRGRGKIRRTEHAARIRKVLELIMIISVIIIILLTVLAVVYLRHPAARAGLWVISVAFAALIILRTLFGIYEIANGFRVLLQNRRGRLAPPKHEDTIEIRPTDLIRSGFSHVITCILCGLILFGIITGVTSSYGYQSSANESSAISTLRAISDAQDTYQSKTALDIDRDGVGEFASLDMLTNATPPYIDELLGSGTRSGYHFHVITTGVADSDEVTWWATAYPVTHGKTGNRTFYIDETGVVRNSDIGGRPVESREGGQALPPAGG